MNCWSEVYASDHLVPYDGDTKVSFVCGSVQRLVALDELMVSLHNVSSSDGTSLLDIAQRLCCPLGLFIPLPAHHLRLLE
jgi:hypothetical protein